VDEAKLLIILTRKGKIIL